MRFFTRILVLFLLCLFPWAPGFTQVPTDQIERTLLADKFAKAAAAYEALSEIKKSMGQEDKDDYQWIAIYSAASEAMVSEEHTKELREKYHLENNESARNIVESAPEQQKNLLLQFRDLLFKDIENAGKSYKQCGPELKEMIKKQLIIMNEREQTNATSGAQ